MNSTTASAPQAVQAWNWRTGAHPLDQSVREAVHGAPVHQAHAPALPEHPASSAGASERGKHVNTTA